METRRESPCMKPTKLTRLEIEAKLNALNASIDSPWRVHDGMLQKSVEFSDFNAAFGFMTRCALAAEAMDHHPDWCNRYRRIDIALSTHEVAGITERDFILARRMETIAKAT